MPRASFDLERNFVLLRCLSWPASLYKCRYYDDQTIESAERHGPTSEQAQRSLGARGMTPNRLYDCHVTSTARRLASYSARMCASLVVLLLVGCAPAGTQDRCAGRGCSA